MLHLVVGHLLQPTTLTVSTHMNHVHIVLILIIMLVIVHHGSWGQFYNFSYEQMNTNFSIPGFDSNSNFYNPD